MKIDWIILIKGVNLNKGILLAAGNSTRFGEPKQLYQINNKTIIEYSLDAMKSLDETIVVTNSQCFNQIKKITPNSTILINDINCRLKSIEKAINHIKSANKIIIHDSARPYITESHINTLIDQTVPYSQYYLKLVNGLVKKTPRYEVVDRNDYIELVTPQIINFHLFKFLFKRFILSGFTCEFLPLADLLKIEYKLIEGNHRHLKKITTKEDI